VLIRRQTYSRGGTHRRKWLIMGSVAKRTVRLRVAQQVAWLSLGLVSIAAGHLAAEEPTVRYRRDILPVLSDRCFKCHGPDGATREAGLRLDDRDAAIGKLESGMRAIVPSDAAASALIERIESTDPDLAMPPADSGKTLSVKEKALIRQWIEDGAEYEPHWAFVAPIRPSAPKTSSASAEDNLIDAFVAARLNSEGLQRSPRASKERLIRRAYFDLIGLPPTLEEIDAYLADDEPDAFDRVVDRLLKSPQYGERMAADWLDGARFADSNGYQNDFARDMSPWRDWVIAAFNAHMPYDQFVTEQLAGDLLPDATLEQRVATGFNRNHRTVTEAGSIEDEWHVENVVDRVETMGTVMLGLTVGCARCHDHKFDPISQREFYELFAFFNNVNEKGVYTETRGNVPPLVKVASAEQQKELAEFDASIAQLTTQLTEHIEAVAPYRATWINRLSESVARSEPSAVASIALRSQAAAHVTATDTQLESDPASQSPHWQDDLMGKSAAFFGKEQLTYSPLKLPIADHPFSWSVWVKPAGDGAILSKMDSQAAARGVDLFLFGDGKVGVHLVDAWPENAIKVLSELPIARDTWSHIVAAYDGTKKAAGVSLYVNGVKQKLIAEVDTLTGTFATEQPLRIGSRSTDAFLHAALADVRVFQHGISDAEAEAIFLGSLQRGLKDTQFDKLAESLRRQFDELMLANSKIPEVTRAADSKRTLEKTQAERTQYEAAIPTTMVMEERSEPRETYLLDRGRYDLPAKDEKLSPNVPAILPPLPIDAPRNRLGLARWIVSRQNPLTARVVVNRLWQQFFGLGLVKTPDNFGIQSEAPSHPELLDWLACELVDSGWNLQHIQRLIVGSQTYQQQSEASPEAYQLDPENRLLARGPRHRLRAEAVRDNALAVSGLLVNKIGGRSVMSYQPEGLWEELAGGAFEVYTQGKGDDLYRRSLYIYRKRTVPHPSMSTFDAPSWEICQVKRAFTNTPLQALALLNDVTYVEAARKFAERIMIEGGDTADERLTFAFRLATGRSPSTAELSTLRNSLDKYSARFREMPGEAKELVTHGESSRSESLDPTELAAHTTIASILLNLDEAISKN
jgi:hypothetical protein